MAYNSRLEILIICLDRAAVHARRIHAIKFLPVPWIGWAKVASPCAKNLSDRTRDSAAHFADLVCEQSYQARMVAWSPTVPL